MNRIRKYELRQLLTSVVIWIIAFQLFLLFRFWGYDKETIVGIAPKLLLVFRHNIFVAMATGALMGCIFGALEIYVFRTRWKHIKFAKLLLIRVFSYLISLLSITLSIVLIYSMVFKNLNFDHALMELQSFITNPHFKVFAAYGLIISVSIFLFGQMNKKIGDGELLNILLGKYHLPKEVFRIFMFIDLESSTHLAARLGHVKFSRLLQQAYIDMSQFVIEYGAKVYQHVGDEVVITWNKNASPGQVAQFFFAFKRYLELNKRKYLSEYETLPRFRAAINMGMVTVAEAGLTKKETVYHGDVLNVAARVQKLCKKFDADLLVTANAFKFLRQIPEISFQQLPRIILEGKDEPTGIYKIKIVA